MICFLDRTFCAHSDECSNHSCRRNLTPALKEDAQDWWSHDPENPPITYSDFKGTEFCESQGGYMPPMEAHDPTRKDDNSGK